ncbi:MAG TPA: ATP-binding protein [Pirellulales bacterium]|nr:ATP-binding protein [Pirellulales bacterium]
MTMKFSLFKKGLILISIPLLMQLAFILGAVEIQWSTDEAHVWSLHSKEVLEKTQCVLRALAEAESGIRGSIAASNPAFLEDYDRAAQEVPLLLGQLKHLVRDNPPQLIRAELIEAGSIRLMAFQRANAQRIERGAEAEANAAIRGNDAKRLMDELRQDMAAFLAEEIRLDDVRTEALNGTRRLVWPLLFLASGAACLVTLALASIFHRGISRRLAILTENARRLASGAELSQPISGGDEIGHLDRTFHEMAGELTRSLTAQREATERLNRLNDELERRVEGRTAELAAANRDLGQQNQENEMFVYSVSHDLRSPLVNLEGFSQELHTASGELRELFDGAGVPDNTRTRGLALLNGDVVESIRYIRQAVARLGNIIDALLRLSRAGRVEYQFQAVDLNTTLARVLDSMRGTIAERGAALWVEDLPAVWGDPTAVELVFANLIGNSLKYLDPRRRGRIEVGVAGDAGPLSNSDTLTFHVRDNGLGIAPAYHEKIFQAFKRVHPEVAEGEGMGLAIVRRIVERHRGKIWVESSEEKGSTFFIQLRQAPVERSADEPFGTGTILETKEVLETCATNL